MPEVDAVEWSEEEKALLRLAFPAIPLSQATIDRCVRAALRARPAANVCTEPPAKETTT